MDTSHYHHGLILLLVLFHTSVFGFASKMDASYNGRRIKIHGYQKRFLSDSDLHSPRREFRESQKHGEEVSACANHKSTRGPITRVFCQDGYVMTKINFADYGNPTGTCENFRRGNCGAPATLRVVKKNCVGKTLCILFVTDEMFGPSHCKGAPTLAVEATCTKR